MAGKTDATDADTTAVPLPELTEDFLANARLTELPFDYSYDTWVLGPDSMRFLLALVRRTAPRRIIEFGSGVSTRALAAVLPAGSVVRSFDHVAIYADRTRRAIGAQAGDLEVLHRPIGLRHFHGKVLPFYRLRTRDCDAVRDADLVIVDGPPGSWGREAALYAAFPLMRPGALLLLDDAGRPRERAAAEAWRRYFGDAIEMHLLPDLGKGMLVVRKRSARSNGRGFGMAERADALHGTLRALWRHRPRLARTRDG